MNLGDRLSSRSLRRGALVNDRPESRSPNFFPHDSPKSQMLSN